mgnify:CR=1 FL=1
MPRMAPRLGWERRWPQRRAVFLGGVLVRGAAERNAVNAPIQGSAADIIKLAMIAIQLKLESENWKAKMLLQVHDELVFDVPKEEVEALQKMVR